MPQIKLRNITKKYGNITAVDNLTLDIENKDFVSLLGPSGCGKTTILRLIAGLDTPNSGEILINDKIVFSYKENINLGLNYRNIGFLFQNYALWPHMTVYKNISFGLENNKISKKEIINKVEKISKMLKIEDCLSRYPSELSGGQQQRVAIARVLVYEPSVFFMDEPMSNIDAKLRMEMREDLKRLHLETSSTIIYVTHDQSEAMTLSNKICLLKKGELQQYGTPMEIYRRPINCFAANFVGFPSMNLIDFKGYEVNIDDIKLENDDIGILFTPLSSSISISKGQSLILGIRAEDVKISEKGAYNAEIYSTLPSGTETIVKLKIKSILITSIVFGDRDFIVGSKVEVNFVGTNFILFDSQTKRQIAYGLIK